MSIYHHLSEILPQITNPVAIEIGAHIGSDTEKIARLLQWPYTYLAVEPDKRCFDDLDRICHKYDCTLIPAAIAAKTGTVDFWQSSGRSDFNSLKKPIVKASRPVGTVFEHTKVQCFSLDDLVKLYKLTRIDFVWMDVQGAELEVIEGASKALGLVKYFYTECQEGRYEGQPGYGGIMKALPGKWKVLFRDKSNVLLRQNEK